MNTVKIDGVEVKVGDSVGFKSDIEQSGQISKIERTQFGVQLTLKSKYGFHGDYIGGSTVTTEMASDCWVD